MPVYQQTFITLQHIRVSEVPIPAPLFAMITRFLAAAAHARGNPFHEALLLNTAGDLTLGVPGALSFRIALWSNACSLGFADPILRSRIIYKLCWALLQRNAPNDLLQAASLLQRNFFAVPLHDQVRFAFLLLRISEIRFLESL